MSRRCVWSRRHASAALWKSENDRAHTAGHAEVNLLHFPQENPCLHRKHPGLSRRSQLTANGFQAVELEGGLSGFVKGLKARVDPTDNGGGSATLQVWIAQSDTAPTAAPADEDVFVRKTSISLGAGHATDAVYVGHVWGRAPLRCEVGQALGSWAHWPRVPGTPRSPSWFLGRK